MRKVIPLLTWITIFSIAMGFLESAVVIYLREIMYPAGFKFPLMPVPGNLALTEVLRELATILMLVGTAMLGGRKFSERFAWFIYAFAVWDIFYYVFLKILINWPVSLMTWDILFMIPTTWTGPVISPIIVSFTMIAFALVILNFSSNGYNTQIIRMEWGIFITGCLILFIAFIWDYSLFILKNLSFKDLWTLHDKQILYRTALMYIPDKFNWALFTIGEIILILTIFFYSRRLIRDYRIL
jgi:hypothetical protein